MLFGWLPNQILKMHARQFFAVFHEAKALQHHKDNRMLYEMTYVATCGQAPSKWIQDLQKWYWEKIKTNDGLPPGFKKRVDDRAAASRIMGILRGVA